MSDSEVLDIRDDAVLDKIANESVSLSLNAQKKIFLKSIIKRLKDLESLLMDTNLEKNQNEIVNLITSFDSYDISNYTIEESKSTLLHLIVNKPIDTKYNSIQIDIFNRLLEKECDLNAQDIYGFTVLHYCCNYNLIEIAKLIINHKTFQPGTINLKTTRQLKLEKFYFLIGSNPIQICSWLNHFELGELLVKHGANINDKNESGWSCIHICARQNYIEFVNFLIENNCNVNDVNDNLKTPLMVAARHGHHKLARVLLNANADITSRNKYGQSPLYVAISKGHMEVSSILLEFNADPNQLDEQSNTPLHACSMLDEKKMLENNVYKNVKIAEMLIQRGSDLTRENNLGWTSLHFCAKNNNINLAELLIQKCNKLINMQDVYGQTALYLACKWKSIDVENLLLKKFANKDIPDLSGITPIHLCSFESSTSLLEKLLEYGDDINKTINNSQKDTPLHIAARNNNSYMINLLINNGADCNKTNGKKQTPLHVAASVGSDQSCLSLLQGGAKINKSDSHGQTPFHSCIQAEKNSGKITKLMVDFGSDINKEFNENMNALALATMNGNIDVVKFLIDKKAKIYNSKHDSVAHLCALKNQCDPECLKLLIDSYQTGFLFQNSLTSYRTPLQLCVEYKSNQFLKSLISCTNISCEEWFKELFSIKGLGISPLVMAISSQNYEFIEELIKMWLEQYDSTHHSIQDYDFFDSDSMNQNQESFFNFFSHIKDLIRREKKVSDSSIKKNDSAYFHGCKSCKSQDLCLFKPNWNDENSKSERYFLNILIRDNENLSRKVLNTFYKTDILRWITFVYLDHVEPVENISMNNDNQSTYIRPLSPVETIYIFDKTELVIHPVIKTLIDTKYYDYAQIPFWLDTFRGIGLLAVWTAFSIFENYSIRHYYGGDNKAGKIVLLVFVFLFFVWDLIEEMRQIYYVLRRINGYKKWVKIEYEKLKQKEKFHDNTSVSNIKLSNKITKYSLIEKEARAIEKLPVPYKRFDNVLDWIALMFQFISLLTHLIDIGDHTNTRAEIHITISYMTTIFIWLRNLLTVYGAVPGIDLVCMLRLIGSQFYRFFFLYIRILIPFLLIFWAMYGGYQIPQTIMTKYWKECETIKYSIPFDSTSSLNRSYFSDVCQSSISVDGYRNFYDTIFTVFQLIFANYAEYNNMKSLYNEFSPIIISIFIIMTNTIGLNFFIGLMSNVLSSGAYKSVDSVKSMELLGYVLQHEWRLSNDKRQKHLNKIKNQCSPKILKYNDVIVQNDSEDDSSNIDSNGDSRKDQDKTTFYQMSQEMGELKLEIKELKELLIKSQLKK